MSQTSKLKSTIITNRDASPVVLTDPSVSGGRLHFASGYITTLAADAIGSTYRMCQVPSNARIKSVILACAAMGTSCVFDVGVYACTKDGGAAITDNFFASGVDVSAAVAPTNVTNQSTLNTFDLQELPLWKALGQSADPESVYDIVITVDAATVNAALAQVIVDYSV